MGEGERGNGRGMGSDGIIMCHSESGIVQKDNALLENKFLENIKYIFEIILSSLCA